MPGQKRKDLLARRRRHDDEGEEDGSAAGDAADYASTAGSSGTFPDEDGERSHVSVDDDLARSPSSPELTHQESAAKSAQAFRTTTDTRAMKNGLKLQDVETSEALEFDDTNVVDATRSTTAKRPRPTRAKSQPTDVEKQRNSSQSQVQGQSTGRSRYFLHDDRHRPTQQPAPRGRGRGIGGPAARGGFGQPGHNTAKQWTHDLHETVNQAPQSYSQTQPQSQIAPQPASSTANSRAKQSEHPPHGPNRSFSTTTILGNVPVGISLPGHEKMTKVMVKKHYTLLPQHRPPLRRDKPVRVSLPEEHARYIFPSTERSFIFIPRAMRPNQQQYRGRGKGSFHGSRRPSVFSYTPSVDLSRRPSVAASNAGSSIHTPTGPPYHQPAIPAQKPVVRMPGPPINTFVPAMQHNEVFLGDNSAIIYSPSASLPMHQPIPQKTVSLADIESPTKAPPQQSQQPFHQQIPNVSDSLTMPHIPEGAIYAQPFQPFGAVFQPTYYGQHFQPGMPVHGEYAPDSDHLQPQVSMAHETNGMVYYYDPSQQFMAPAMDVMQQPAYYYPPLHNQMFYQ